MSSSVMRGIGLFATASVLIGFGIAGIIGTHEAFVPCELSQTTEECLQAMDRAEFFAGPLQLLWAIALILTVAACALAPRRGPRMLAIAAACLVGLMNQVMEYAIWLGVYGGHWDVPPGTGYTQSASFILAALLLAMAAAVTIDRAGVRLPRWGDGEREAAAEIAAGGGPGESSPRPAVASA